MEYVTLGRTGLQVSRIALGMMSYGSSKWREWVLDEGDAEQFVRTAVDAGINFFDTADMYSNGVSEEVTGRLVHKCVGDREQAVIATKVFNPMGEGPNAGGLSRKHVLAAIDESLRRLDTDYVDLYIIHRWDPHTPIDETMEALHDVVRAGKARYLGASSMWAWQFAKAQYTAEAHGWTRFSSMQNHYNLAYREEEREMIPLCLDQGVGLTPWSPLARGLLAGNRSRFGDRRTTRANNDTIGDDLYSRDSDFDIVDAVVEVAETRGVTPAQVALAWLLHKPGVVAPIVGATKEHHLSEAIGALDVGLDQAEIDRLEAPYRPRGVAGHQ